MGDALDFSELCHFSPKQWLVTQAADLNIYTLFGGRRFPGKSYWLRWYLLRRLLEWGALGFRNVRCGLFCETFPALKERQITKIESEFPDWLGTLKEDSKRGLGFYLKPYYGGGSLALLNLDDRGKYKSAEFAGVGIDELTQNPQTDFDTLRGSMRWPGIEACFFVAATNPDGPYRAWVRRYWIERDFPPEMARLAGKFVFVPGEASDNPYVTLSYTETLDSLPDKLRAAWRDGDWYVSFSDVVYSEFGADNITTDEPDPTLPIELAFDDGYIDPRAILLVQRASTRVLVFDELYHTKHLEENCVAESLGLVESHGLVRPTLAVGSPEAVQLRERFRLAGIPARGDKTPIVEGIKLVRSLICDGRGVRTLKVHSRCRNLLGELTEGYRYDPKQSRRNDEVPLDENNHAADALRYWAWVRAVHPSSGGAVIVPGRDVLADVQHGRF